MKCCKIPSSSNVLYSYDSNWTFSDIQTLPSVCGVVGVETAIAIWSLVHTHMRTHTHKHMRVHTSTHTHTHPSTLITFWHLWFWSSSLLEASSVYILIPTPYLACYSWLFKYPQCLYSWFGLWPFLPTLIMHTALLLAIFHLCLLSSPQFSSSIPSPPPLLPKKRPWEKNGSLWSQYSTKESWGWPRVKWRLTRSLFPVFPHVSFRCVSFLCCPTSGALLLFLAALVDTRGTFT